MGNNTSVKQNFAKTNINVYNSFRRDLDSSTIYKGTKNEFSQSVALNVAAGLIVSGKENNFKTAFDKTTLHLTSGDVFQHLIKIQST